MRLRGAAFEVPSRFDRVPTHRFFAWSTTLKVAFIKGVGETSNHYVLTQSLIFSLLAKLETVATLCDREVAGSASKQSIELGVSFPAHIQTLLTSTFFPLR